MKFFTRNKLIEWNRSYAQRITTLPVSLSAFFSFMAKTASQVLHVACLNFFLAHAFLHCLYVSEPNL